jgi:hypothetical protein
VKCCDHDYVLSEADESHTEVAISRPPARMRWTAGVVFAAVGALVAAGVILWAHFGGAIFFDMIAAGIASCI